MLFVEPITFPKRNFRSGGEALGPHGIVQVTWLPETDSLEPSILECHALAVTASTHVFDVPVSVRS